VSKREKSQYAEKQKRQARIVHEGHPERGTAETVEQEGPMDPWSPVENPPQQGRQARNRRTNESGQRGPRQRQRGV
jgi:hypothetical protein